MTDIVDLLDAMFTDDESGNLSRLLITTRAANEIERLRDELAEAKELLADALPRLVEGYRLRAENAQLRDIVAAWDDAEGGVHVSGTARGLIAYDDAANTLRRVGGR